VSVRSGRSGHGRRIAVAAGRFAAVAGVSGVLFGVIVALDEAVRAAGRFQQIRFTIFFLFHNVTVTLRVIMQIRYIMLYISTADIEYSVNYHFRICKSLGS